MSKKVLEKGDGSNALHRGIPWKDVSMDVRFIDGPVDLPLQHEERVNTMLERSL